MGLNYKGTSRKPIYWNWINKWQINAAFSIWVTLLNFFFILFPSLVFQKTFYSMVQKFVKWLHFSCHLGQFLHRHDDLIIFWDYIIIVCNYPSKGFKHIVLLCAFKIYRLIFDFDVILYLWMFKAINDHFLYIRTWYLHF